MYTAEQIQKEMRAAEAEDYETRIRLVEAAERIIFEAIKQAFPGVVMKIESDYLDYRITLVGLFLTPPPGKYYCLLTPEKVRWRFGQYPEGTKVRIFAQDICGHLADGSLEWIIEQLKTARGSNMKIREDVVDVLLRCMLKLECGAWEAADAVGHLFDSPPTEDECGEASLRFPHVRLEGESIIYSRE